MKASVFLKNAWNCDFDRTFEALSKLSLELDTAMWRNVLWNPVKKTMITTNGRTVENLLIYCIDKQLLQSKQNESLLTDLQGLLQADQDTILNEYLDKFVLK